MKLKLYFLLKRGKYQNTFFSKTDRVLVNTMQNNQLPIMEDNNSQCFFLPFESYFSPLRSKYRDMFVIKERFLLLLTLYIVVTVTVVN